MAGDTLNINTKVAAQNQYDALVIGSGISSGWAADYVVKELKKMNL